MSSKPGSAYHAYRVRTTANKGKLTRLRALLPAWRRGLAYAMGQWTLLLVRGEKQPRWMDAKRFPGPLSQRQWNSVTRQARAALDSWIELREDEFRRTVNASTCDKDLKHRLHSINIRHAWWEPVDDDAHRLARHIIKHLRKRVPFPDMRKCRTMSMDGKIARIERADHAFDAQWWAVVSTLDRGKPVRIPLNGGARLEQAAAKHGETVCNHLQVTYREDGAPILHMMTVKPKTSARTAGDTIGMDWGLNCLFATSRGERHGMRMFAWLQARDRELTALTRSLAKSGIRYTRSRRYRNFARRIREYLSNEVNRILNQLSRDRIRQIVVEELDFRDTRLSRPMNRILRRCGRGAVKRKLQDLTDNHGITVTTVNPAYTSQQCASCGYVTKRNRPDQQHFRCTCCGHRLNADINASHNILARRSREDGWGRIGRRQILATLLREHDERYHPNTGGHAAKSAATPRATTQAPEVKVSTGIKYH